MTTTISNPRKLQRQFIAHVEGATATHVITSPMSLELNITLANWQSVSEGEFTFYNLAESTRQDIYQDWNDQAEAIGGYRRMKLWAGYLSWVPESRQPLPAESNVGYYPLIFDGLIRKAYNTRQGPNWMTTILPWDGGFEMNQSQVSNTFPKGQTFIQRVNYLAAQLQGISVGYVDQSLGNSSQYSKYVSRGVSYVGSPWDYLRTMAYAIGSDIYIQFGKLYMLPKNKTLPSAVLPQFASLSTINGDSGLLNTPTKQKFYVSFDMIFEPRLFVGQSITLNSEDKENNGTYTLAGVNHRGIISDGASGDLITTPSLWYGGPTGGTL
ncbi:MAG: hypothetical protein KGJ13_04645 [Patescibacteria group bacterium]|nr:hypothetical protein [Patescibacteria group bacterium]